MVMIQAEAKTTTLIGLLVVLVIIAGLLLALSNIAKQNRVLSVNSFAECAAAGYPIMESYPERCATPDGRSFTNPDQDVEQPLFSATSSPAEIFSNGCVVAGCSSQLCISADAAATGGGVSDCMYRAEYACYREASCEPQRDGKCGWTMTTKLQQCLNNPPPLE